MSETRRGGERNSMGGEIEREMGRRRRVRCTEGDGER